MGHVHLRFEATRDVYLLMMKIQNILNKINSELRAEPDLIMFVVLRGSLFHQLDLFISVTGKVRGDNLANIWLTLTVGPHHLLISSGFLASCYRTVFIVLLIAIKIAGGPLFGFLGRTSTNIFNAPHGWTLNTSYFCNPVWNMKSRIQYHYNTNGKNLQPPRKKLLFQ